MLFIYLLYLDILVRHISLYLLGHVVMMLIFQVGRIRTFHTLN